MVAGESSGEATFRGYVIRYRKRMGTDDSDAGLLLKIESSYIGYRADFIPISIDLQQRNISPIPSFFHFHPAVARVMILLGINSSKSFLPRLERWELASSSFRRELEPFYRDLGSGQGRRHVSHAAHYAATINDRRVIKVGQCPYYIARDIKFCDHRGLISGIIPGWLVAVTIGEANFSSNKLSRTRNRRGSIRSINRKKLWSRILH